MSSSSSTRSFANGTKPKPIITVLCCHCGLPNQLALTAESSQGFNCWDCHMAQYVISVEEYESIYLKKSRKSFSFFSKKKTSSSENSHVAISLDDKNAIDAMKFARPLGAHSASTRASAPGHTESQSEPHSSERPPCSAAQSNEPLKPVVKDMTYYDLLNVPHDVSASQIRKQYYLMAMKYHPDKNPGNPEAETQFKKISEAYQILSDAKLRARYDALGSQELSPEGGFMSPEDVFKSLFGGEKFVTIIGEISLGRLLADLMVENAEATGTPANANGTSALGSASSSSNRPYLSKEKQEEMRRVHEARVEMLLANLVQKTSYYTEGIYSEPEFREYITKEALDLSRESFGVPLLHSIGYVYLSKAKQRMGKESFLGLSGFMSNIKEKGHIVASLMETIGAVREVAHDANAEEKKEAQRRKAAEASAARVPGADAAEPSAASHPGSVVSEEKMKRALWKASSFEVEATLREVCERFLSVKQRELALKRAFALKLIGDVYRSVRE